MTNRRSSGPLILILGPQGSGKGTQIKLLGERYGLPSVSAGELLRTTDPATELGRQVHELIDTGKLVTIDLWEAVVVDYLDHVDLSKGYLLDGVVRTLEQQTRLERLLVDRQLALPWVLSITLTDDIALARLMKRALIEGRTDDTEAAIRARLAWSRSEVQPVIDHYRSLGRVVEVNGDQSIERVHHDIVAGLATAGALPQETHGQA